MLLEVVAQGRGVSRPPKSKQRYKKEAETSGTLPGLGKTQIWKVLGRTTRKKHQL